MPRRGSASPADAAIGGRSAGGRLSRATIGEGGRQVGASRRLPALSPRSRYRRRPPLLAAPLLSRPPLWGPERDAGTMFRRKLTALDYHNPAGFNCKGEELAPGRPRAQTPLLAALSAPSPGLPTRTLRGLVSARAPGPRSPPGLQAPLLSAGRPPRSGHARASEPLTHSRLGRVTFCTCSTPSVPHSRPPAPERDSVRFLTYPFQSVAYRVVGRYLERLGWASAELETEEDAECFESSFTARQELMGEGGCGRHSNPTQQLEIRTVHKEAPHRVSGIVTG